MTKEDLTFDVAMSDWADHQFFDRELCRVGEKLKVAADELATHHRCCGVPHLPRFRRVLRSWIKNGPKQSRLPMPLEHNLLISHRLGVRGRMGMALYHSGLFCGLGPLAKYPGKNRFGIGSTHRTTLDRILGRKPQYPACT